MSENVLKKLTTKEKRLIEVLANPENTQLSIDEVCAKAGCNRRTFWLAKQKDVFLDTIEEIWRSYLKTDILPIVHQMTKKAKKGDAKCISMVLDCIVAREPQKIEHSGNVIVQFGIPRPEEKPNK